MLLRTEDAKPGHCWITPQRALRVPVAKQGTMAPRTMSRRALLGWAGWPVRGLGGAWARPGRGLASCPTSCARARARERARAAVNGLRSLFIELEAEEHILRPPLAKAARVGRGLASAERYCPWGLRVVEVNGERDLLHDGERILQGLHVPWSGDAGPTPCATAPERRH